MGGWRKQAQAVADSSGQFQNLAEAAPCLANAHPVSEQTVAMTEISQQLARTLLSYEMESNPTRQISAERPLRILGLLKLMPLPDDSRQQYVRRLVDVQIANYSYDGADTADEDMPLGPR